jgi:hypothetical protein
MTGEEAAAALKAGIEALFAEAREARPCERAALIEVGQGDGARAYVYVAFSYGRKRVEGRDLNLAPSQYPQTEGALAEMVGDTIKAVAKEFRSHATLGMVWRVEPQYGHIRAQRGSRRHGWPGIPAHHALYCRLVAVPPGAIGVCRECGVVHEEHELHFLTDRLLENVGAKLGATPRQVLEEFLPKVYGTLGL